MTKNRKTGVIGAGAWGTALAWSLASNGATVTMWALEREVVDTINTNHENSVYLPGVALPSAIRATMEMGEAVKDANMVIFAAPAQFMRETLEKLTAVISADTLLVCVTKGIENNTLALPADMIRQTMPGTISARSCYLSGPTFAKELVRRVPTAATIASHDPGHARQAQEILSAPWLRLYTHHDVTGVELGGAVKNVIAIASGIADGLGFGHNTRSALITRGLAEMTRLGVVMGAEERTFAGLSGVGDLTLTCAGDLSRNRSVGLRLGQGEPIDKILASMKAVAEGVATSISVHDMAEKQGVDMPIAEEVYQALHKGKSPEKAVADLMNRALKEEFE